MLKVDIERMISEPFCLGTFITTSATPTMWNHHTCSLPTAGLQLHLPPSAYPAAPPAHTRLPVSCSEFRTYGKYNYTFSPNHLSLYYQYLQVK